MAPTAWIALGVFAVALVAYAATLAPTVTLVDSGELIMAAWSAGVPHPPGFPLYAMLAHLATRVPIGEVALRVNAASALFGALTAAAVALAAAELVRPRPVALRKKQATEVPADPHAAMLAAATAGLLFAFSRAFWSYATIAEVYTLNSLVVALVLVAVLRWRAEALAGRRRDALLWAAAGLFGLALGVHHVTVAVWAPGLALLVVKTDRRAITRGGTLAGIALAALAGLAVYLYLPLAASRAPAMNWGDPDSPARLFRHVSGWMYQTNLSLEGGRLAGQLGELVRIAARQYGPWWLPAGLGLVVAGAVGLFRRDRTAVLSLSLVAALATLYALAYDIAEDTEAYYLPLFLVWSLLAGVGAVELLSLARRRGLAVAAPVAAALAVVVAFVGNYAFANRRGDLVARDYVRNVLATVEPGGLLLTDDWQLYSPLLYATEVAGERRDVVAVDVNLLRRSWYVEALRTRHPELAAAVAGDLAAYLDDLRAWEADPDRYAADRRLTERIDDRYHTVILAMATEHAGRAPVYVTQALVVSNDTVARALNANWQAVPHGLVFRLYGDRAFHEPPMLAIETRSLTDGSRRTEPDDVVELKVRPVYAGMLVNRGLYFAMHGRVDPALEAARAALAVDPSHEPARRLVEQLSGG